MPVGTEGGDDLARFGHEPASPAQPIGDVEHVEIRLEASLARPGAARGSS